MVVLDVDFSENAGVQFDRTATMYIANTNVYFGTTPEPLSNATNTWHIERDVTDYAALFSSPQQGRSFCRIARQIVLLPTTLA